MPSFKLPRALALFDRGTDISNTEPSARRKPFAQWVKNLASKKNKGGDRQEKSNSKKGKKALGQNGAFMRNNPYPESGHLQQHRQSQDTDGVHHPHGSYGSLPNSTAHEPETRSNGNRSGAPTLATNAETIHSDAGHSKAATTTTHGGALSSIDGAGADSTFSSPNHSQHSLTTTLTTIQSTSANNTLHNPSPSSQLHGSLNNTTPVMFSHQYPVSPAPSTANTISAIPRHMQDSAPNTYSSATAHGLLSDNASIITLASSSKRRRRSMDTDASVRAMAPSSVWGGSRESLPLSVLSGNAESSAPPSAGIGWASRPSIGGLASAERTSIYSGQGGLASERNSYIKPGKDIGDAKSLRSITNMDARSLNADTRSLGGGSLLNYESSVRSGKTGHARNDSTPGSIGGPLGSATGTRHTSGALSRGSIEWQRLDDEEEEEEEKAKRSLEQHENDRDGDAEEVSAAVK